jgi:hypothetical protein
MFLLLRYLSSTRLLSSLSTRRTKKNETRCRAGGPARRERGTRIVSPDLSGRLPAALDSSSPERSMTELCRLFRALLRPVLDCFLLSRRYFSPGCRWTQQLRRKIFVRVVIVTVGFGHVYSGGNGTSVIMRLQTHLTCRGMASCLAPLLVLSHPHPFFPSLHSTLSGDF